MKKEQKKSLIGSAKFTLVAKVELSPDEYNLIQEYYVGNVILFTPQLEDGVLHGGGFKFLNFLFRIPIIGEFIAGLLGNGLKGISIAGLVSEDGYLFQSENIGAILDIESQIANSMIRLKEILITMKNFGGKTMYE